MMIIQTLLQTNECYTHPNWVYRDVNVDFSRLYYIIDGEAYYEEEGVPVRFRPNHLYLTPVRHPFSLYENPNDKLLHTFAHIITLPSVTRLIEIEVIPNTPLADAVTLWRKYVHIENLEPLMQILQLILCCMGPFQTEEDTVVEITKRYLDSLPLGPLSMKQICRELGYSREYLTGRFSSVYHITPLQYFNQRKMNVASEKLKKGMRVFAIAEELQFSSPYAFSKAFKNHFGLSPEAYRLTLKTDDFTSKPS